MSEAIAKGKEIVSKLQERDVLLETLAMWKQVEAQGIDPEAVDRFSFDPHIQTDEEAKAAEQWWFETHAAKLPTKNKLSGLVRSRVGLLRDSGFDRLNPYGGVPIKEDGKTFYRSAKYNVVILRDGERRKLSPPIDNPHYFEGEWYHAPRD